MTTILVTGLVLGLLTYCFFSLAYGIARLIWLCMMVDLSPIREKAKSPRHPTRNPNRDLRH